MKEIKMSEPTMQECLDTVKWVRETFETQIAEQQKVLNELLNTGAVQSHFIEELRASWYGSVRIASSRDHGNVGCWGVKQTYPRHGRIVCL